MTADGAPGDETMDAFFVDVIERLRAMHDGYREFMDGLTTDELDWSPGVDMNSLCVLGVHVTEAERFWIGIAIDDRTARDRPAEFRASGYDPETLRSRFDANMRFYAEAFAKWSVSDLDERVSYHFQGEDRECSRGWALLHALNHTAEHLGHAGMTRQLLDRR